MDVPLSESSVSFQLEEIQKRCRDLLQAPDSLAELTLDEPTGCRNDPYNRQQTNQPRSSRRT